MAGQMLGKYARAEIERRFLLRGPPVDMPGEHVVITDRYLLPSQLRLRVVDNAGRRVTKLTQKFRSAGQSSLETTITNLVLGDADVKVLAGLEGPVLEKRRHIYVESGRRFGVDVFLGPLAGLILAEIEFESLEEARLLAMPTWAECEVTAQDQFTGGALVGLSARALSELLAQTRSQ